MIYTRDALLYMDTQQIPVNMQVKFIFKQSSTYVHKDDNNILPPPMWNLLIHKAFVKRQRWGK